MALGSSGGLWYQFSYKETIPLAPSLFEKAPGYFYIVPQYWRIKLFKALTYSQAMWCFKAGFPEDSLLQLCQEHRSIFMKILEPNIYNLTIHMGLACITGLLRFLIPLWLSLAWPAREAETDFKIELPGERNLIGILIFAFSYHYFFTTSLHLAPHQKSEG